MNPIVYALRVVLVMPMFLLMLTISGVLDKLNPNEAIYERRPRAEMFNAMVHDTEQLAYFLYAFTWLCLIIAINAAVSLVRLLVAVLS